MEKILISACFLGERVRYNGKIKSLESELLDQWQIQGRLILICPEVFAGLPVPRPPSEINPDSQKVMTITNLDIKQSPNYE